MRRVSAAVALLLVCAVHRDAAAHRVTCTMEVQDQESGAFVGFTVLHSYGAGQRVRWRITVTSLETTADAIVRDVADPLLAPTFQFMPPTPFTLPPGGAIAYVAEQRQGLGSLDECLAMVNGGPETNLVYNYVFVTTDSGVASCGAVFQCGCVEGGPGTPGGCPTGAVPTRDEGFFKVRPQLLEQCLAGGGVQIGELGIGDVRSALGLLWMSPGEAGGAGSLGRERLLLARAALTAACNARLFGDAGGAARLVDGAGAVWRGRDCRAMTAATGALRAYAEANVAAPLPASLDVAAQPRAARQAAVKVALAGGDCR